MASQVALVVKNPPASTEDLRDMSSIPGLGRSSGGRHRNPLQLGWRIPWTEEPGGLQSMGSQRVGHNWRDLACMTENILFASLYHFSSFYDIALIIQLYSLSLEWCWLESRVWSLVRQQRFWMPHSIVKNKKDKKKERKKEIIFKFFLPPPRVPLPSLLFHCLPSNQPTNQPTKNPSNHPLRPTSNAIY